MFDRAIRSHSSANQVLARPYPERNAKQHFAMAFQRACALGKSDRKVRNMFKHFKVQNRVEALVGKRQMSQVLVSKALRILLAKGNRVSKVFAADGKGKDLRT